MLTFRKHPECDDPHTFWDQDAGAPGTIERACSRCMLLHILDRIYQMPLQSDFDSSMAAFNAALTNGFSDLDATIATETAAITAAVANAGGIPQSVIDAVNTATTNITAATATAKAAVVAELPSSSTT